MTATLICLTVLAIAAATIWLVRELVMDARATRIAIAEKKRQELTATSELARAIAALERTAAAIAPAPVNVGSRVTVHLADGEHPVHGIVLAEYPDRLRLGDAHLVTTHGKEPVPGGLMSIAKDRELFRQEHEG